MKLWLISQTECDGYDTYSDAVVAAETEETAKMIHPDGINLIPSFDDDHHSDWTNDPLKVSADYIGEAKEGTKQGVICASFHAG